MTASAADRPAVVDVPSTTLTARVRIIRMRDVVHALGRIQAVIARLAIAARKSTGAVFAWGSIGTHIANGEEEKRCQQQ